jgi:hypothetical protein
MSCDVVDYSAACCRPVSLMLLVPLLFAAFLEKSFPSRIPKESNHMGLNQEIGLKRQAGRKCHIESPKQH